MQKMIPGIFFRPKSQLADQAVALDVEAEPAVSLALEGPTPVGYRRAAPVKQKAPKLAPAKTPEWFLPIQDDLPPGEFFAYVPWIREHTDALVNLIKPHTSAVIAPLHLVRPNGDDELRRNAMASAIRYPEEVRSLLFSRFTPLAGRLKAVVFTFDWHPFARLVSTVCEDLGITRILIPHESVFAKRTMYYVDSATGIDRPSADLVLAWGDLQSNIFKERRYPPDRIEIVGAPKFDAYRNGRGSAIDREMFSRIFDFHREKPVILFSAQPLDSQFDAAAARTSQQRLVSDLVGICQRHNWQLLIRTPPSRALDVLGTQLREKCAAAQFVRIDQSGFYRVTPFDALSNCDAIVSVNSTMLFEGILLNKPSISAKYIDFDSFWTKTGIPFAHSAKELESLLKRFLSDNFSQEYNLEWASKSLSNGEFDGNAATRIGKICDDIWTGARKIQTFNATLDFILDKHKSAGNVAMHTLPAQATMLANVQEMLRADNLGRPANATEAFSYDHYARWGLTDGTHKKKLDAIFNSVGGRPFYIEDGFIRSLGMGLSGDPALSIILDDLTPYYNAAIPSRLQTILDSDFALTDGQLSRVRTLIINIRDRQITKYNHAPKKDLSGLRSRKRAILLVDQRAGDQSIASGMASAETFFEMAMFALTEEKNSDVFVKIHPDAITGGKDSALSPSLRLLKKLPNLHVLDEDVNPYSLFAVVDEVWVVSSGMGFEALMAGKPVRCFGAPFYAGRGLTRDELQIPHRAKQRSLEEIFHVAYLMLSRYYSPRNQAPCELEELVNFIDDMLTLRAREGTEGGAASIIVARQDILASMSVRAPNERRANLAIEVKTGAAGHAVYGPYLPLRVGTYRVVFIIDAGGEGAADSGTGNAFVFEVVLADEQKIIAQKAIAAGTGRGAASTLSLDFEIQGDAGAAGKRAEFRVWSSGEYPMVISSIVVEQMV